jgi:glycosyltransferase involved in cell wall biosynthesis
MAPLVSVIVPTYNCETVISDTVKSVQRQSLRDWELLAIDDCSSDGTLKVLQKFGKLDSRIKVHSSPVNAGRPAVPRNFGLDLASGKYVAFLDADDLWHRQKLEIQINFLEMLDCKFISSQLLDFGKAREVIKRAETDIDSANIPYKKITHSKLLVKNCIPNSSVCIERSLLENERFIDDVRYKAIEDYHLWLRLHQKIPFSIKLNVPLLFYRRSDSGISKSKISMFKKNHMLYSEYYFDGRPLKVKIYMYLISYIYFSLLRELRGTL